MAAINSAFREDKVIGIFAQKNPRVADPGQEDLYKVGTIATITQMMSTEGEIHAVIKGQARISLDEVVVREPHLIAKVEDYGEEKEDSVEIKASSKKLSELFKRSINLGKQAEIVTVMKLVPGKVEHSALADQVASLLDIRTKQKQELKLK